MDSLQPTYDRDRDHLRLLSIFHYVVGGFTVLASCIFIFHIVMGLVLYLNPDAFPDPPQANNTQEIPPEFGLMFVAVGSCAMLFGWTHGILTIISGKKIKQQKNRIFSLVVAGINCLSMPFGTALGICTFIVLLRESVVKLYENKTEPTETQVE